MALADKPLNEITEADLQELIDNQVAEGKEIDYKLQLWGNSNGDKKEFLADVSSFANTVGGHLIIGMSEQEGVPKDIVALEDDMDKVKGRFESMIRTGIAPRIQGIDMKAVPVQTGHVLIIRIPRSWAAPHIIWLDHYSKFYARNSMGKYQLDVDELRTAFTLSQTNTERIRNFRLDRIAKVATDDTPTTLSNGAKLVLHIVPIEAFSSTVSISALPLDTMIGWQYTFARPIVITDHRYNLDGLLFYGTNIGTTSRQNYIQIFRNGAIEYVNTEILNDNDNFIPSLSYEQNLIDLLPSFCSVQEQLGFRPPTVLMLTLLNVRDYAMGVSSRRAAHASGQTIDRDNLIIPDILIDSFDGDFAAKLKPIFDIVWNACGWVGSRNYDKDGYWNPPPKLF